MHARYLPTPRLHKSAPEVSLIKQVDWMVSSLTARTTRVPAYLNTINVHELIILYSLSKDIWKTCTKCILWISYSSLKSSTTAQRTLSLLLVRVLVFLYLEDPSLRVNLEVNPVLTDAGKCYSIPPHSVVFVSIHWVFFSNTHFPLPLWHGLGVCRGGELGSCVKFSTGYWCRHLVLWRLAWEGAKWKTRWTPQLHYPY